jgi:hypothetical protein
MDDRKRFAALTWASQLGLLSKNQIIAKADRLILECNSPDSWLIEVSLYGESKELDASITRADDDVFSDVLRRASDAWNMGNISDQQIVDCCRSLWLKAGYESKWYTDLVGIEDAVDFVKMGYSSLKESRRHIREAIEGRLNGPV